MRVRVRVRVRVCLRVRVRVRVRVHVRVVCVFLHIYSYTVPNSETYEVLTNGWQRCGIAHEAGELREIYKVCARVCVCVCPSVCPSVCLFTSYSIADTAGKLRRIKNGAVLCVFARAFCVCVCARARGGGYMIQSWQKDSLGARDLSGVCA